MKTGEASQKLLATWSHQGFHKNFELSQATEESHKKKSHDDLESREIFSPVTGKVFRLLVQDGERVKKGQSCFLLESMKLEFEIKAPAMGILKFATISSGKKMSLGSFLSESEKIAHIDIDKCE